MLTRSHNQHHKSKVQIRLQIQFAALVILLEPLRPNQVESKGVYKVSNVSSIKERV